jgi:hypothetical protein
MFCVDFSPTNISPRERTGNRKDRPFGSDPGGYGLSAVMFAGQLGVAAWRFCSQRQMLALKGGGLPAPHSASFKKF